MSMGKLSSGEFFRPPPAGVWNDMVDAGIEFGQRRRLGFPSTLPPIPTDIIKLKNTTGGNLPLGRVMEIGSSRLTNMDPKNLWFTGSTPAPNGTKEIAVALWPIASNGISDCQLSGVCLARINITHPQHVYADVDSGNTLLQSKWHGRVKIITPESLGNGDKLCLVRICEMFRGPIKGIVTQSGGIPPRGSGSVKVRWAGADSSPISTVTVHRKWMVSNRTAPAGTELLFWWYPDEQIYDTGEEQCP